MKIENVSVTYTQTKALDGVTCSLAPTEKVAILGKSGSGKTTLLRAIASLVLFDGEISNVPTLSFVFQTDRLVAPLSVAENIRLVAPDAKTNDLLSIFGLEGKENADTGTLSGGEKRRVSFARALAHDSQTILADEPFTGLDLSTKWQIIRALSASLVGRGFWCVTHDLDAAYELCDRILVIDKGKIVVDASASEFDRQKAEDWFRNA